MARFKNVDGERIPFTQEEEDARDLEEAQAEADATAQLLTDTRKATVAAIKAEGLSRIATHLPEMTDIDQLATIWRMVEPTARSVAAQTAKSIYDVAVVEIAWANDPARTQAELDAYDPTAAGWP